MTEPCWCLTTMYPSEPGKPCLIIDPSCDPPVRAVMPVEKGKPGARLYAFRTHDRVWTYEEAPFYLELQAPCLEWVSSMTKDKDILDAVRKLNRE